MSGDPPGRELRESADILFAVTLKADELRFDVAPDSSVEFTEDAAEESSSGSDREGLPDEVREDVTYHDVQIDYAIAASLNRDPDA